MARTKKVKAPMNDDCTTTDAVVQSGSDDGTVPESTNEGNTMTTELDAVPEGYTHTVNPTPEAAKTKQEIAAEKAQAKVAAKSCEGSCQGREGRSTRSCQGREGRRLFPPERRSEGRKSCRPR